jgi:hypothetical protein
MHIQSGGNLYKCYAESHSSLLILSEMSCIKDTVTNLATFSCCEYFLCLKLRATGPLHQDEFKEHALHICLYQQDKSVMANHSITGGHHTDFKETTALVRTARYTDYTIKQASGILLHAKNFKRQSTYSRMSCPWWSNNSMFATGPKVRKVKPSQRWCDF